MLVLLLLLQWLLPLLMLLLLIPLCFVPLLPFLGVPLLLCVVVLLSFVFLSPSFHLLILLFLLLSQCNLLLLHRHGHNAHKDELALLGFDLLGSALSDPVCHIF